MSNIKVEIGQYRVVNKKSLKAFFSLIIYPHGQKILDCRYFINGDQSWFSFPSKEIKYTDGRKSDYIPLISFMNKEYLDQLKIAVLEALKNQESNENSQTSTDKKNSIQTESPPVWDNEFLF